VLKPPDCRTNADVELLPLVEMRPLPRNQ
jgi:hypothetical protein